MQMHWQEPHRMIFCRHSNYEGEKHVDLPFQFRMSIPFIIHGGLPIDGCPFCAKPRILSDSPHRNAWDPFPDKTDSRRVFISQYVDR